MKLLTAILSFGFILSGYAGIVDGKSLERAKYSIKSDVYSEEVPVGFCKVKGTIFHGNQKYGGGLISTLNRNYSTTVDSTGEYELLINDDDTSLFFFQSELEEIVIWNYKFKSKHIVTIDFFPGIDENMMIVDKPVIYMYSEESLTASLNLSVKGDMIFSYPAYEDGWNVEVNENGISDLASGQTYPYLFWEGQDDMLAYSTKNGAIEGFFIDTKNTVEFLEEALSNLGFNQKEKVDFITFWAPRMIQSPYAMVQFLVDEEYDSKIAGIEVTPAPDAMRRVYMIFTPMESSITPFPVVEQKLTPFERTGFTVLEWGGSEVELTIETL